MELAMESLHAVDGRNCGPLVAKARFRILSTFVTAGATTRQQQQEDATTNQRRPNSGTPPGQCCVSGKIKSSQVKCCV